MNRVQMIIAGLLMSKGYSHPNQFVSRGDEGRC